MDEEQNNTPVVDEQKTEAPVVERKGFNITSMILGIISIFCLFYNGYLTLICSIIAIVFSVTGRKDAGRGMGIAGLVLGIIALVIYLICVLAFATILGYAISLA